jgi:hypothetical protein
MPTEALPQPAQHQHRLGQLQASSAVTAQRSGRPAALLAAPSTPPPQPLAQQRRMAAAHVA